MRLIKIILGQPVDTKRFAEVLKSKTKATNVMTGERILVQKSITVFPKTTAVFTVE